MNISFLNNGIDSLQKGFEYLKNYEERLVLQKENTDRFFLLKDAILSIHHGIEILMKHILQEKSPYLVFSNIDPSLKKAFREMHHRKLKSVFQTSLVNKIHTVSYDEALERLIDICGIKFSDNMKNKIRKLNEYRNQITHSEIFFNESEISELFEDFLNELDMFFLKIIGKEYKTLSGYSDLVKNFNLYKTILEENNLSLKKEFIECLLQSFKDSNFGMGINEVKRTSDIETANKIVKDIIKNKFILGTDLFNGFNSGKIKSIERRGVSHLSIITDDTGAEHIFKFKSLIIFLAEVTSNLSPILIFESDEDRDFPDEITDFYSQESIDKRDYLEGIYFYDKNLTTYNPEIIRDYWELESDGEVIVTKTRNVYKFKSRKIFCFFNIQGLPYGGFRKIIQEKSNLEGKNLEILLRKTISK